MYDEKSLQGIGNKIKLLRTLHKISQQELSQQLGVSQTAFMQYRKRAGSCKPAAADAGSQFV